MRKMQPFTLAMLVLALSVSTNVAHAQTYSVLYNFGAASGDPSQPANSGIVAQGRDGNLYSTTINGGTLNSGAVFKITPTGTVNVVYSFDPSALGPFNPVSGLTLGTDGNFYGTTHGGGTSDDGTIFKMTPTGSVTVLHSFTGFSDGYTPDAPPVQGTDGNFYGTTIRGGNSTACGNGCGVVYKITPSGKFTTLYTFDSTHGFGPRDPLVQGTDGNFYGTTFYGGSIGGESAGVVFKITSAGKLVVLYNFDGPHGQYPVGPLVEGTDGNFYGTTLAGGTNGDGVIFKITPSGNLTVLHSMNAATDGYNPNAGLVQATDGNLYGANTYGGSLGDGTLFKITTKGSFSVLHNFNGTGGLNPFVTPFQHTNGVIYGDTQLGGTGNVSPCIAGTGQASCGVFYSLNLGLHPFVSLLSTSGRAGQVVEILGSGLTGATSVKFGKGSASFAVVSSTYMTAVVPTTGTTGVVSVTTPSGTRVSSKNFKVLPVISSFSPTSGPVAMQVVIKGTGLTQTTAVTFGGIKATTFTVNSSTQVTVDVPAGAKTGKIAITTPGGTATSSGTFTVT